MNILENMIRQIMNEKALSPLTLQPITKQLDSAQPIVNFDLVFSGKAAENQKILTDIAGNLQGENIFKTLQNISNFFDVNNLPTTLAAIQDDDDDGRTTDDQISNFFSNILAVSVLDYITGLDQSAMGFYLESWFSMIIKGKKTGQEGDAIDFVDNGVNYSSKFIIGTSPIEQTSAEQYDQPGAKPIYYVVGLKNHPTNITNIKFYAFKAVDSQSVNRLQVLYKDLKFLKKSYKKLTKEVEAASKAKKAKKQAELSNANEDLKKVNAEIKQISTKISKLEKELSELFGKGGTSTKAYDPFRAGVNIEEKGIPMLQIPLSNLYKGKYTIQTHYTHADPFMTLDLEAIRAAIPTLADNLQDQQKNIFSNILSFIENIDALKALLGYYFQTFDNTIPIDIVNTAENCKKIVDFFNNSKTDYSGFMPRKVPSSAAEIIANNKELLEYEQLPDITTNQGYNMLTRGGANPSADATLDQIKNNISGKNHEEKIKSFCDQFNNLITQTATATTAQDYKKIFSILVAAQSIYRIVEEVYKGGEAGSGGFSMENFLSMFMTGQSGVYGGNQELADVVQYDETSNTLYGYSSKFKKAKPGKPILKSLIDGKALNKEDFKNYGNEPLYDQISSSSAYAKSMTAPDEDGKEVYIYYVSRTNKPLGPDGNPYKTIEDVVTAVKEMEAEQKVQFIDDVMNLRRDQDPGTAKFNFNDIVNDLTGGKKSEPKNVKYTEITVDQIGKRDAEGIMQFKTISDIAFYKQEFIIEKSAGSYSQSSADGKGKELFAILNFSKTNFDKVVENITTALNKSNYDFTSIFEQFNTFKLAMYSFFEDPNVAYIDTANTAYEAMKAPINKIFATQQPATNVSIKENKFKELDLMIEHMVKYLLIGEKYD